MINKYDFIKKIRAVAVAHDKFFTNHQYKESKVSFPNEGDYEKAQESLTKQMDLMNKDMTEDIQHMFDDGFGKGKILLFADERLQMLDGSGIHLGNILVEGFEKEEIQRLKDFFNVEYKITVDIDRFEDLSDEDKKSVIAKLEKINEQKQVTI